MDGTLEDIESIVKVIFKQPDVQQAFISIKYESFDLDCRRFLNIFNVSDPDKCFIFSIRCAYMKLGNIRLTPPIVSDF